MELIALQAARSFDQPIRLLREGGAFDFNLDSIARHDRLDDLGLLAEVMAQFFDYGIAELFGFEQENHPELIAVMIVASNQDGAAPPRHTRSSGSNSFLYSSSAKRSVIPAI